jgi:hypothetical protein
MRLGRLTADAHHLNVKRQRFPGLRMVQVHGQFFIIGMKPVKSSSQSQSFPLGPPKDKLLQVYEKHNICDIALKGVKDLLKQVIAAKNTENSSAAIGNN